MDIVLTKHEAAMSIIDEYDKQTNELNTCIADLKVANRDLLFQQEKLVHDIAYTRSELEAIKNKRRRGIIISEAIASLRNRKKNQKSTESVEHQEKIDFQAIRTKSYRVTKKGAEMTYQLSRRGLHLSKRGVKGLTNASSKGVEFSMKRFHALSQRLKKLKQKDQSETLSQPIHLHPIENCESNVSSVEEKRELSISSSPRRMCSTSFDSSPGYAASISFEDPQDIATIGIKPTASSHMA